MNIGIFYASKYGTTKTAVEILKDQLKNKGYEVDTYNIKKRHIKMNDIKSFDLIIIGGSIYMGKIQNEVNKFCQTNDELLLNNPLGLFLCCSSEEDFERQLSSNFNEAVINHASIKGYFGYGYNLEKMNFLYKKIIKKVANISSSENAIKSDAIETFAEKSHNLLKSVEG